jgi:hypothetical protein
MVIRLAGVRRERREGENTPPLATNIDTRLKFPFEISLSLIYRMVSTCFILCTVHILFINDCIFFDIVSLVTLLS